MNNTNTPMREAMVIKVTEKDTWTPACDVDPIMLPVDVDGYADVFDPGLIGLIDGLITWDALDSTGEYLLVWSSDRSTVKGVCPTCDEVFPVSEGYPIDRIGASDSVCCGCEDAD